jgi:hypothetical protein
MAIVKLADLLSKHAYIYPYQNELSVPAFQ